MSMPIGLDIVLGRYMHNLPCVHMHAYVYAQKQSH